MLTPPIEPMLARSVPRLPEPVRGQSMLLEPKFDGFRAIAFRRRDSVFLQSRAGRNLTPYFPDIVRTVHTTLPANVVLDGELIVWEPERDRTSFSLLQQRVTAGARLAQLVRARPATFVVFDLLQDAAGVELLTLPLSARRALLVDLLAGAPPALTLCPQTTSAEQALDWIAEWTDAGIEGVVGKDLAGRYTPGRRGWQKFRTRATTEAIVGGVTGSPDQPQAVLLGRFDAAGRLRYVGRTVALSPTHSRDLARALARPGSTGTEEHPWPLPLPASWTGQLDRTQPLPYRPVAPTVVVEISVDTAFEHRRWRHLVRYLRTRAELSTSDVPGLGSG